MHRFISGAFYFVPFIYISVFVPVPYCLDDCGFVVEPEVRQVDSSSSILLSQDCFGYLSFLYFHTNWEIICSSSVKNAVGSLIGIALNLLTVLVVSLGLSTHRIMPSIRSDQIRSVAHSCLTLCDPMNRSTPGLPVPHQLPEFTQTHVHRVSDAIQPSHPLSSPSPPAPNPSQHQSLFQ